MNVIKTSTLVTGVMIGAVICSTLIVNSKEALALADTSAQAVSFIDSSVPEARFQRWFKAKLTLEKYKNPLNYDYQVSSQDKAHLTTKFQDERAYEKEINRLEEKIKLIEYFRQ